MTATARHLGLEQSRTGIRFLDRLLSGFEHPQVVAEKRRGFLLPYFSQMTGVSSDGRKVLSPALIEVKADSILSAARAVHDAKTATLRDIAASLPQLARESAAAAHAALVRDPSAKTAAALLSARAALAEADKVAADIEMSIEDSEQAFLDSEPYRLALAKACRSLLPVLKRSDLAAAMPLGFRACALAESLENGHPAAAVPAAEFLAGRSHGKPLDSGLIPAEWVFRLPSAFKWDAEGALSFA